MGTEDRSCGVDLLRARLVRGECENAERNQRTDHRAGSRHCYVLSWPRNGAR